MLAVNTDVIEKGSSMFKPFKMFFRFTISPWLWVLTGVLFAGTAVVTCLYQYPVRRWQWRQAGLEVVAAGFFFVLAVIHRSLARSHSVRRAMDRLRAFRSRWWKRLKRPVLITLAAVAVTVTVFALYRWRSNVALAKEIRAEFDAWLETLPKVPDSENGMLVVLEGVNAFSDYQEASPYLEDYNLEKEGDRAFIKELLASKEQALELICRGLEFEKFQYPTDYSEGPSAEIPSLLSFRCAAEALIWQGELAGLEGRKSDAIKEYLNALRLGRTLADERFLISAMIKIAVEYIGLQPLTKALSEGSIPEEDMANALETMIELHGKGVEFFEVMESEFYAGHFVIAGIVEGKLKLDDWRWEISWYDKLSLSKYIHNYRHDVDANRNVLETCRNVDPAKYWSLPREVKDFQALLSGIKLTLEDEEALVVSLAATNVSEIVRCLVEVEVIWRGAIALAGIRLFEAREERFPENLSELGGLIPKDLLVDPFSGRELVYRVERDDFFLYSVGYDGIDGKPVEAVPYFEEERDWRSEPDMIIHAPGKDGEK